MQKKSTSDFDYVTCNKCYCHVDNSTSGGTFWMLKAKVTCWWFVKWISIAAILVRIHHEFQYAVRIRCGTDAQTQARLNHAQIPL